MSKKDLLQKLYNKQRLNSCEAEALMIKITQGELLDIEISALLMYYKLEQITIDELAAFRKVLLQQCCSIQIPFSAIDVCGTGGDEKNTFNISTLSALVLAGCGYKVVKHGNYGVSSTTGSSNVLEYFGYNFTNDRNKLLEQLEKYNICFLHAPLFHPALKHVAPVRKALGTRTLFNLLGPLINPCNVSHKFTGVNSLETMRMYNYLLQQTNINYSLVNSLDGYDEISLTGKFKLMGKKEQVIHPNELGFDVLSHKDLSSGSSIKEAAAIFMNVLNNKATEAQKNAVLINSAFAIQLITNKSIQECISQAKELIESKKALNLFTQITQRKHEYA